MTTDRQKAADHNSPQRFVESFDDFCVGLIDLKHMRAMIAELLESESRPAEAMLVTIDTAFREGLIKASTYELLTTDIDRATSEDEPTEWSEQTREQVERSQATSDADDTGYPAGKPGASQPGTTAIDITAGAVLKNRFELASQIGAGSMADVYEAIDRRRQEAGSSNPRLAIKVISKAFSAHAGALETLQREALNSQGLVHPNVVRVLDFDRDGDRFFMTMELLDGQSLAGILNEHRFKPLPFSRATSIIRDVCQGLGYAHEHGVIHADIKPGNIFVSAANQAKILDFGIARIAGDGSENDDSPVAGAHTPAYASCEVLEGGEPTEQDDIFSMACVAYRMLAGRRAFGDLTALDAERKHIEPQRIETLNPQQWQALQQSLSFRHADRTTNISEFATAFYSAAPDAQPADKPRYEPDNTPEAPDPRGLPLRFGIPAIAVLLIAITLALFWPEPEPARLPIAQSTTVAPDPPPEPVATIAPPGPDLTQPVAEAAVPPAVEPDVPVESIAIEAAQAPSIVVTASARIDELAMLADKAMNDGRLLDPDDNNARLFVMELAALAPETMEVQQRRTRLAELMLLEAMVAITDEEFDIATRWIAETRALDVPDEMTQRFEVELQKARDAKRVRQAETLGAIFASATPAAILADPGIDFGNEQEATTTPEALAPDSEAGAGTGDIEPVAGPGSLSLTMVLPGSLPDTTAQAVAEDPAGELADTTNQDIALSVLEFKRYVEPKLPRGWRGRGVSGWVEVRFRVTANGRTDNINVVAAKPDDRFNRSAIAAISKWRFEPVIINGVATEKYSAIRLRFQPE